ncbi:MAG: potassium channel protein [Methanosarcinales archaeon]|nr:potassium channel protein [Methanosarcinales archaeon]
MHETEVFLEKHIIILGYGDVGRSIVKRLITAGVSFVVVDHNKEVFQDEEFFYIIGEATSESTLKKAGVETASTIITTIESDSDIIFSILLTRKLNPGAIILARANEIQSIDKMYKAGADYVASLTIVSGQMLGRIALLPHDLPIKDETILMYEGIEIKKYTINAYSHIIGKTLAELDLRNIIGCTVIGIQEGDKTMSEIDPNMRLTEGLTLAILGNKEQIERFSKNFIK